MVARHRLWAAIAVCVVGVVVGSAVAAPASAAPMYPVNYNIAAALATGTFDADTPAPGVDKPHCRSTNHPVPVVLVHGTMTNQNASWQAIGPELANNGYCVYSTTVGRLPYSNGFGGVDKLENSATELAAFVTKVRKWTGAPKVDLIGHSQGAAINLTYLDKNQGYKNVARVVGLAGANNAPEFWSGIAGAIPGAQELLALGIPAASDLLSPASFRFTPRTYPGIEYVNIVSRYDELAIPKDVAFLPPGPNVRNLFVQSFCPDSHVGHLGMIADPGVTRILLNELDPGNRKPMTCAGFGIPF
ncbi:esterase/lipase family protein [Gordonia sp. DT101]|uniref:esterase/lipase family protein n=1 Tax=Gordonia sp. DT101 TaxID=3416545 RepID=UPI003CF8CF74